MSEMNADQFNAMLKVASDVSAERERQHEKWGEQNLPDGTGYGQPNCFDLESAREEFERALAADRLTYEHVLTEEYFEAVEEADPVKLRAELVQVAAVAQAWVEAIDRRSRGGLK